MLQQFQSTPAFSFPEFLRFCEELAAAGKTSGPEQSEFLAHFTKLNFQRMKRWYGTHELSGKTVAIAQNARPQNWFVITEAWCGDSAQNLPLLAKIGEASAGKISLSIVLRDEHPHLIDAYLTNGSRSIPKLVSFDAETGEELFVWGPRPASAEALLQEWKKNPAGRDFEAFEKELHTWYARNKGQETEVEIGNLLA